MEKSDKKDTMKNNQSELDKFKLFFEHVSNEKAPVSTHLRTVKRNRWFTL